MRSPEIDKLYDTYRRVKVCKVNNEQFGTLVLFFPALLVVACDGVVDDEEWVYVKYLSKFIADTFKDQLSEEEIAALQESMFAELEFLTKYLSDWEQKFLKVLKEYLAHNSHVKEDVVDILHMFAEASEGESDEEEAKIEELTNYLELSEINI
ncbi:hypothetical protein R9C00_24975 [Flammeovirgaceae bacterium SG7u.111]|nr:hypothetical protein [Flammeovirgaceae bacterium SG7u.132]WPO34951.1 hypothetical protein R9C00_24975 [Flammeovirgaceae bacterium SG7u.111]